MSVTLLSEKFKAKRSELGFSLRDVEQITELSNAYISQLENGKIKRPSAHALFALCAAYGISYEDALAWMGVSVDIPPPRVCGECGRIMPPEYVIDKQATPNRALDGERG